MESINKKNSLNPPRFRPKIFASIRPCPYPNPRPCLCPYPCPSASTWHIYIHFHIHIHIRIHIHIHPYPCARSRWPLHRCWPSFIICISRNVLFNFAFIYFISYPFCYISSHHIPFAFIRFISYSLRVQNYLVYFDTNICKQIESFDLLFFGINLFACRFAAFASCTRGHRRANQKKLCLLNYKLKCVTCPGLQPAGPEQQLHSAAHQSGAPPCRGALRGAA